MSNRSGRSPRLSRRGVVTGIACTAAYAVARNKSSTAEAPRDAEPTKDCTGLIFSPTGPYAEHYGAAEGYPVPAFVLARQQGNPWEPKYRVGTFSHLDEIYSSRQVDRATLPWRFKCSPTDIRYQFRADEFSLIDYMSRNPVTGLLVVKDDQIFFERYQYGRTDHNRFVSQSMVKSITGILIGIAISEGAIRTVDDTADTYVPGFKGTEYGATPIRALLHMSSGVDFGEERDGGKRS